MAERAYLVRCGKCGFLGAADLGHCAKCGYDGFDPPSQGADWVPVAAFEAIRDELRRLAAECLPGSYIGTGLEGRAEGVRRTRQGIADQLDEALGTTPTQHESADLTQTYVFANV